MTPPNRPITLRVRAVEAPATPVEPLPGPAAPAPLAAAPSRRRRLMDVATSYWVSAPVLALALALLGWSGVRFGRANLVVKAREQSAAADSLRPAPAPEEIAHLRQTLDQAATNYLADREAIVPLVAAMEERARQAGWRLEVALQPALPPLPGLERARRFPATLRFEQPASGTNGPASTRQLTALFDEFCRTKHKVDLARLSIRANDEGITTARAEIHFWTKSPDEKTAAK